MLLRSLIGWLPAFCLALFWPTQDPAASESPVRVVASFSILADLARQIDGSDVEVTSLIGPDSDAHFYEPKPEQARLLSKAQLFLVNGLGFEGWLPRLIDELAREAGTAPRSAALLRRLVAAERGGTDVDRMVEPNTAALREGMLKN
jgi:zinc/manganese transport system substrate-binding protein